MMPILKFVPQFKSVLWGGSRIAIYKGLPPQGDHIGESWELSCVPGHESEIADGPYKGRTLRELMLSHGREILGDRLFDRYGTDFPLLIKVIDSNDDLSIQVHPDDCLAAERHHCPGKTEMWVCVAPEDGAYLYSGFNKDMTPEEYVDSIRNHTIVGKLGKFFTHKGDVFFLPAGRVHSIGKGNLLIEIQETSDITYRIYDYDRRDASGNPRELHINESIAAVNFSDSGSCGPTSIKGVVNMEEIVADCDNFTTTALKVCGSIDINLAERNSFTVIIAAEGDARIVAPDNTVTVVPQGSAVLIPANMPSITISGDCSVLTSYIR